MQVRTQPEKKQANEDRFASFLGLAFQDPNSLKRAKAQVDVHPHPRDRLAAILEEYNKQIGNDEAALANSRKLAEPGSYCVVTGQQLGMMGGPIYTILKGVSCLLAARDAGAVPVFWLATEDHDIPEIDHTYLIDSLANFKQFRVSLPRDGSAVEDIRLTPKNIDEIKAFWEQLGQDPVAMPTAGDLYSKSMMEILVCLFVGTGMVFLEPKLLRPLSRPFFIREIRECQAIQEVLKETTLRLENAGGHPAIKVGEATNLFYKDKSQKRRKLRFDGEVFTAGSEHFTTEELLGKVESDPQLFSCNVAARPVLQNLILPVIAYVAGPAELEYHHQLGDYHKFHGVDMPCIIPRISATFIPSSAAAILERCHLEPWDEIPMNWTDVQSQPEDISALPGNGLHLLRNLIHPHNKPQERLLNWWGFQVETNENLVQECLEKLSWNSGSHYYLYL